MSNIVRFQGLKCEDLASFGFELQDGRKKQFKDVTLGSFQS